MIKDSHIKLNRINDYLDTLMTLGTAAGEPFMIHLEGEIWELRPISDRVLFAAWDEQSFIILHYIVEKSTKTPRREIEQAKRNLADYRERIEDNGEEEQSHWS